MNAGRLLGAAGIALGVGLAVAPPATAASWDDEVVGYDLRLDLAADGTAMATLDLSMDFGTQGNHGPYLTWVVKQQFDETRDRVLRISDVSASSDTAPDAVDVSEEGALLVVRIGDEDVDDVVGRHDYRVTFTLEGAVNPARFDWPAGALPDGAQALTGDELYLDVIEGWQLPIDRARVTVTGPSEAVQVACYTGPTGSTSPCSSARQDGAVAVFDETDVPVGHGLSVVVGYPAGTFETAPILQDRWAADRAFALTPATGTAALLVGGAGAALAVGRVRRRGRDQAYLGLTPGLRPAPSQPVDVGPRGGGPVAVQFTPPVGFRPGQLGTLIDEHADTRDVTATIVDLAVRGYLVIEQLGGPDVDRKDQDWRLVRTDRPDDDLLGFEHLLLGSIFTGRREVALSELRTTFAASLGRVQQQLYDDVTARGWFRADPRTVRRSWVAAGAGLLVLAVVVTTLLAIWTSWAVVGLPLLAVGVLVMALAGAAPARTADGTAVLAQTRGFHRYLATAEAEQLRWEEGQDLFSRYLPYAVAFGLTARWTAVFADLAARGVDLPVPTWYVGAWGYHGFWAGGGAAAFTQGLAGFTALADTAISAPTPSTSGGSGFGGGGFSGGGFSGGGGGSW